MTEQNNIEQEALAEKESFETFKSSNDFDIIPYEDNVNLNNPDCFKNLDLSSAQKAQISVLVQHMPAIMATGTMAQAYVARFPQGLPHTLTALNQGGVGSMIREGGRYVGSASFYSLSPQATIVRAFTAMSVASGQYFLTQINNELRIMQIKVDEILGFLYGEKKAELMAEMSFAKYAYQNYEAIMNHEQQRIATIVSLQEARKIAMKDIEFYLEDLGKTISDSAKDDKKLPEKEDSAGKCFKLKESLDLSLQLYVISNVMEVHYSQNQDLGYLESLRSAMLAYIDKCDRCILSQFNSLKGQFEKSLSDKKKAKRPGMAKELQKLQSLIDKIEDATEPLCNGEESPMKKIVQSSLAEPKCSEYYLDSAGNVYVKNLL